MKQIDKNGLILCELQGQAFQLSVSDTQTSSEIFIRRFMKSDIARKLDGSYGLTEILTPEDILSRVEEQYGKSEYGSVKFSSEEMYWIGYLYRYFAYTYDMTSPQIYKLVKGRELRKLYVPYHSLDCSHAIDRILESKNRRMDDDSELQRQYAIFVAIRRGKKPPL
ncbi:MAG: antitoxin [Eubacterium sp.]|nr:antitoxin [Candidatus Colimonas fimequi]